MSETIAGLHHVTMIAGNPQRNIDFYCGVLGLRLVKVTVNFDDPGSYHLYYGDELGRPGTILTFFSWPGAYPGRVGNGQATTTALSVPPDSIAFWQDRLTGRGFGCKPVLQRFDETVLPVSDPDGLRLELVATEDERPGWSGGPVDADHAIRGLHSVTLLESNVLKTDALLTGTLGFSPLGHEAERTRYQLKNGEPGAFIDVTAGSGDGHGRDGVGTIHHVAWRVHDQAAQMAWRAELLRLKLVVSPVMDRSYFTSIYFREPDGVLFELATESPGFTVDEDLAELGGTLKLPPQYESSRAAIERHLPKLRLPPSRAAGEGTRK